jgi:hypothetical protein
MNYDNQLGYKACGLVHSYTRSSPESWFAFRSPVLRHQKATHSTHQHQHRGLNPIAAGPRHRALNRRKNPANAQIVRRVQKRQRPDGHQRSRPQTAGKNEEISNRGQVRSPSPKHPSIRQRENKTPHPNKICTFKIRRATENTTAAAIDRAGCSRNRRALRCFLEL